jgi:hypothetical protein
MKDGMTGGFYNGELGDYEERDFQQKMMAFANDSSIPLCERAETLFREITSQYMLRLPDDLNRLAAQVGATVAVFGIRYHAEVTKEAICMLCGAAAVWTEDQIKMHIGINLMPYINAAISAERRRAAA